MTRREGVFKFGRNMDVDMGIPEDIWTAGGIHVPPTVARIHDIVSTSIDDVTAGIGAETVEIVGLNASYSLIFETITLNGITNVQTTQSYIRIDRMIIRAAGSIGANIGTITAIAQIDGTLTALIEPNANQTQMAFMTIPSGTTAFIDKFYASVNRASASNTVADIELLIRPLGQVFQTKQRLSISTNSTSFIERSFNVTFEVFEKSDIRIRASVNANNTDISAGFDLTLVSPVELPIVYSL